jgi:tetratricopeptide (TPR) repeat protein
MRGIPAIILAPALAVALACFAPGVRGARAQDAAVRGRQVEALLEALRTAPDAGVANLIEQRVRMLWAEAGSPAAALLQSRGLRDLVNNADKDAVAAFDAALTIDPGYASAYANRAVARFRTGDVGGAIADIEKALRLDPSLFPVFDTLSRIAEARGDWQAALLAWQRYAEADPKGQGVQQRLRELQRKAEGEKS